jgi:PKD repeat protein
MKTNNLKNTAWLLVIVLMIFARSMSAQTVVYALGNVSDLNGNPIAYQDVYLSDDTISMNMAMATTDVNGDYIGMLTTLTNQGILFVGTEDCNNNLILNTHTFSINTTMITSDFVICASNVITPCALSGAYVSSSPNGLTAGVMTMPPSGVTYVWSNGQTTNWSQFYQNWCVTITDINGCDTTICDTSSVPCNISLTVYHDTITNTLTPTVTGGTAPYNYNFSNGWAPPYFYTPGWCLTVMDANGCIATVCDSSNINPPNCIDPNLIDTNVMCQQIYNPVCGCDSVTYPNPCVAENYFGVTSYTYGACGSTSTSCQADFTAMNIGFNPNAVPVVVQFTDMSAGNANNWLWDFGDGTTGTGQYPVHSYAVPGTYLACLLIEEVDAAGTIVCTDIYCDSVWADTIGINPPSCYAYFWSNQVSASDSTFFTNSSTGAANATYFWDFGDGTTSTDENPIHLYTQSGTYYACLTIMDSTTNCFDTYCSVITVIVGGGQGCQAYFYGSPGWNPNSYEFFDYSSGNATNWLWDFGDGNTSTQQNPVHTYGSTGTGFYLICLTISEYDPITQALVCTDTYCDSIYLMNQPSSCYADFYAQDLGNNEAMFANTSYPQTGSTWFGNGEVDIDYGDGNIDYNIGSTINHTYSAAGTYYVCVTVWETDSAGTVLCTDTYCDSVTVTSGTMPCQADFQAIRDTGMVIIQNPNGTTTTTFTDVFSFMDLSTPVNMIQSWQWDMGDNGVGQYLQNTSSTSQMPVYEFDTNGVYNVCLTIVTMGGQCTSTTCDSIDFSMMQGQTAVNEVNAIEQLTLYPNPANDKITISLMSNTAGNLSIRLVNMMGQTLRTKKVTIYNEATNHSLDVSEIANGVYSVEVVLNGEKQYQRVVISR